ncbi:hypothetical protein K438DRAFT_2116333 [Mycena galopus ATCC 62051]|nr:hypothetical protein K438DRAFT_2116333 [Mycena galopus ATCC 62051]
MRRRAHPEPSHTKRARRIFDSDGVAAIGGGMRILRSVGRLRTPRSQGQFEKGSTKQRICAGGAGLLPRKWMDFCAPPKISRCMRDWSVSSDEESQPSTCSGVKGKRKRRRYTIGNAVHRSRVDETSACGVRIVSLEVVGCPRQFCQAKLDVKARKRRDLMPRIREDRAKGKYIELLQVANSTWMSKAAAPPLKQNQDKLESRLRSGVGYLEPNQ